MTADLRHDEAGQSWMGTIRSMRPTFLVTALVLLVAAAGLNWTVNWLQLHFVKARVEPRKPLKDLPTILGTWVMVDEDTVSEAVQEALKADQFVFRKYVNAAVVDPGGTPEALRKAFQEMNAKDREEKLKSYQKLNRSDAILTVSFTYYTGKADTVAHIPEVCYVASGYEVQDSKDDSWPLESIGSRSVPVRMTNFQDVSLSGNRTCYVTYFFQANGKYYSDSAKARLALTSLFEKYAYYAKIEIMSVVPDPERAEKATRSFVDAAMPDIEQILPDWGAVTKRAATQPAGDRKEP